MVTVITPQVFQNYNPTTGVGDPSTPLSKAFLDAWAVRLAADITAGLAAQVASDALAYAPMSHNQTASTISDFAAAVTALIPAGVGNLSGTYAARPAANTVPAGTVYYCSNVPEQYRSDGAAWAVVGSGGNEIGYAQTVAPFSTTSATPVDVPALTTTFVVGERPVKVTFDGPTRNTTAATYMRALIVVDGVAKVIAGGVVASAGEFRSLHREVRLSGLTPGSTHTAKIQLVAPTGGTLSLEPYDDPAFIQVVTV